MILWDMSQKVFLNSFGGIDYYYNAGWAYCGPASGILWKQWGPTGLQGVKLVEIGE